MPLVNDDDFTPEFVILAGVVVAFVGTLSAVLWGIATGTGGDGDESTPSFPVDLGTSDAAVSIEGRTWP